MAEQHTYGAHCGACEGHCLEQVPRAGFAMHLTIGQHVRHRDYQGKRVTGTIRTLTVEDRAVMATICLDSPIVIPPGDGFAQIVIRTQHVPAHELAPFDERDEVIVEMLKVLQEIAGMQLDECLGPHHMALCMKTAASAAVAKFAEAA